MTGGSLHCRIELPADYRRADFLGFHRRDSQMVSERVDEHGLHKGIAWQGLPACLSIRLLDSHAAVELAVDGAAHDAPALQRLARRMLGLTQGVEAFEHAYRRHPQLGPLIARNAGLRVPLAATPFEAITWAVTGQQISVGVAVSLRRRLIQHADVRHSGGLWCHPQARQLAGMTVDELRGCGFSQSKANAVIALAQRVEDGTLALDAWAEAPPVEEIRSRLAQIRGIGPWTVNYALLRGFGHLDGSLHGDVAVRRKLQQLLGSEQPVGEAEAQRWLAGFSPWRALVGAHLWAMRPDEAGAP